MDGDRAGQLAIVEHLDKTTLLAQQTERDDGIEGELGLRSGGEDFGNAIDR
jgi:hypothetical protein